MIIIQNMYLSILKSISSIGVLVFTPVWKFDRGTFWQLKQKKEQTCVRSRVECCGDGEKTQINIKWKRDLSAWSLASSEALPSNKDRRRRERGGRGRDREGNRSKRNESWRQSVREEYKQCLAKYKNRPLSLSRLSLCSYFIPFVRGTWRTGLQKRLQWAHQSPPTDCGPTDTLEMGINFFVENVETAHTKWGNESSFFFLCYFCLLPLVQLLFQSFLFARLSTCQRRRVRSGRHLVSVRCSFGEVSVLRSASLCYFLSLSHSPLSLTLLTSSLWVQPTWLWAKINAHMCLQLAPRWTDEGYGERKADEQKSWDEWVHGLQTKYLSNRASAYRNNGRIIKWEMFYWCFVIHSCLPQVPFSWPVMDGARAN